jgi:hypothetical protein
MITSENQGIESKATAGRWGNNFVLDCKMAVAEILPKREKIDDDEADPALQRLPAPGHGRGPMRYSRGSYHNLDGMNS